MAISPLSEAACYQPKGGSRVIKFSAHEPARTEPSRDQDHPVWKESGCMSVSREVETIGKTPFTGSGEAQSRR
jgi:hypothetical protein